MNETSALQFLAGALGVLFIAVAIWLLRGRHDRDVERVADPYIEGLKLLIDGRREEAFLRLQQAIVAGTAPTDAYIRIGKMLRERGDSAKALQIHKSLTIKSDLTRQERIDVFANLAEDYLALTRPDRALEAVETAMRRTGLRDATLIDIAARSCHSLDRAEEAYEYLKELKKAGGIGNREIALYLTTVAEGENGKGRARDARKTLIRALRHDPECASALLALGRLEEKAGDMAAAIRYWRQAATLSSELAPVALRSLERALYQRGTFNDIETVYRDVLDSRPGDEHAALALASFYRKQGRTGDALHLLEDYGQSHPGSVASTVLLSSLYASRGDSDELEDFLDRSERALERETQFRCGACGHMSGEMRWHCPRCNRFDTFSRNTK
jgi:lipopolysaccharide biosynthesis regulator YciM